MKRLLSFIFLLAMLFTMTTVAGATEESIYTLARRTITVKETIQDNGVVVSTYEHMDAFTQAAKRQYPNLSDYELSQFLMDYMGMDSEGIPEEEALKLLTYDNLSLTSTYLKVNDEGIVEMTAEEMERQIQIAPMASWTSEDGYMILDSGFTKLSTSGSTRRYSVWMRGVWKKYPATRLQDVIAIGTNASFDDSFAEKGYVHQTFKCGICGNETKRNRDVTESSPKDGDLKIEYKNLLPLLRFNPTIPQCDACEAGNVADSHFATYLCYGVVTSTDAVMQPSYAHKTLGASNISVSIDSKGGVSFSVGLGSKITTYLARPVTLA